MNPAFKEDQEFMEALVESYSYAGNVVETNKILNISNSLNYFNLIKKAIRGYARKSHIVEHQKMMVLMDNINNSFGQKSLFLCAEGINQSWKMQRNKMSKRFTTHWKELPIVKCK